MKLQQFKSYLMALLTAALVIPFGIGANPNSVYSPVPVSLQSDVPPTVTEVDQTTEEGFPFSLSVPARNIVNITRAGLEEAVVLAYIENSPTSFSLTAEDIAYLEDQGISPEIITAVLAHDKQVSQTDREAAPVSDAGPNTSNEMGYVGTPPEDVSYFYKDLAPYGSWLYVEGQGWCWRPAVAVEDPNWVPYCDGGQWLYSDAGWYWHSDYPWGWAPFHYGRWSLNSGCGWVWAPGTVWAPAWVTWRSYGPYCGWAPLPPGVGFGLGLGFGPEFFTFVSVEHVFNHDLHFHRLNDGKVRSFFHRSTVINNGVSANNTIINKGIDPRVVATATGRAVTAVQIRDVPNGTRDVQPDQLTATGTTSTVSRLAQLRAPADPPGTMVARRVTDPRVSPFGSTTQIRRGSSSSRPSTAASPSAHQAVGTVSPTASATPGSPAVSTKAFSTHAAVPDSRPNAALRASLGKDITFATWPAQPSPTSSSLGESTARSISTFSPSVQSIVPSRSSMAVPSPAPRPVEPDTSVSLPQRFFPAPATLPPAGASFAVPPPGRASQPPPFVAPSPPGAVPQSQPQQQAPAVNQPRMSNPGAAGRMSGRHG